MEKVYPVLGKIFLGLIGIGAIAGLGWYANESGLFNTKILQNPTPVPTQSVVQIDNNYQLEVIQTPLALPQTKTVNAGLGSESGLSFTKYSLELPLSWADNHINESQGVPIDTLTFTKDGIEVKLFQAATGGNLCLYPGDAPFEGPSSYYETFNNINTKDNVSLRRSGTNGSYNFTICQKSGDGSYQAPTTFGHISITSQNAIDAATLSEIDNILQSLTKI